MKKVKMVWIITAMIVVICSHGITAFASGGLLGIDNKSVYEGMKQSYDSGYAPVQTGDNVQIVLPLVLTDNSAKIQGNIITVTPKLGEPSSSPFEFKNYQKTVEYKKHNASGVEKNAFLVQFNLTLKKNRNMGSYPVVFEVEYTQTGEMPSEEANNDDQSEGEDSESSYIVQQFTVYVDVDGKDPNAEPRPDPTPEPCSQPKLIVSSYKVNPEIVKAGEPFQVTATIQNTSEKNDAKNIKVTYEGDGKNILPADNVNTQYIKLIKDGESEEIKFDMKSRLDSEPGVQTLTLTIEYEDKQASSYSVSSTLRLQVTQPLNIEFDEPQIPSFVTAGDSLPLALNVFNKGRSKVYNVMCKLEADGFIPEGSAYIGNMEPGTSGNAEIYVFIGALNMKKTEDGQMETDRESDERYGETNGVLFITYEDEFGKEYSKEIQFESCIQAPVIEASNNTEEEVEEEPDTASQWWISILIGAVLIAGVVTLIMIRNKRRSKALGDGIE